MGQQEQSRGDAQLISEQGKVSTNGAASDLTPPEDAGGSRVSSASYIERRLRFFTTVLKELRRRTRHLDRTLETLKRGYLQCLDTAANCQAETTKFLNHELERHALNPAIETVVALAEELFRLRHVALHPNRDDPPGGHLQTLTEEINISAQIAQEKLDYLGVAYITPSRADFIDPKKHSICRCTDTKDKALHGTVSQLVRPGVMYRGEVLRPADVAVFRYCEVNDEQNKTKACV